MQEISMQRLTELMGAKLEELGSPLPFSIWRLRLGMTDEKGRNWRVWHGPVDEMSDLQTHGAICTTAWKKLSAEYNLEPDQDSAG